MRQWFRARDILAGSLAIGWAAGFGVSSAVAADCIRPQMVVEGTYSGTNRGDGGTLEAVCQAADRSDDAWFEYLAPQSGVLNVSVRGKAARHAVSVWEGCPNRGGGDLVCRDDGWELQTVAGATVTEGNLYQIRVASLGAGPDSFEMDVYFEYMDEAVERGSGPDVTYQSIGALQRFGPVGTKYAFILDSGTCNIGDQNLRWGGSWQGSPSLAMNMYRLSDGRLVQLGQSFTKQACCAAATSGCGVSCNGVGGSMLGAGCRDFYGAGWNSGQSRLGPRSNLNAFTGAHILASTNSGDSIFKRLQVEASEIDTAQHPTALWFFEGVYVASDDAAAGNNLNNASYRRAAPSGSFNFTFSGVPATQQHVPAIQAWRANGLGAGVVDNRVVDGILDVPSEGRFHTAYKVTDLGNGSYRYDYAIFNLTSDRAGGSVSVPLNGATPTNIGFHDVDYHSGEPYDNTDWVVSVENDAITWRSPQTFAQNPNSNALRWGTMYNFWFETDRAPEAGDVTMGLFKPHTPQSVTFAASVPSGPAFLVGDMNCDGFVTVADISGFVLALTDPTGYAAQFPDCDINAGDINDDSVVSVGDIAGFVALLTN